eukprot:3461788-Amphidinium_carterae.1
MESADDPLQTCDGMRVPTVGFCHYSLLEFESEPPDLFVIAVAKSLRWKTSRSWKSKGES